MDPLQILVLEDRQERQEWFRVRFRDHDLTVTASPVEAMALMRWKSLASK